MDSTEQGVALLLPLACAWVERQECDILRAGIPLTPDQIADARLVGVRLPDRVRLLRVAAIPAPDAPVLATAARAVGLVSPFTIGLTVGHRVFVRADQWSSRRLVAHELAHVMQYERAGGSDRSSGST
jgi:hypothetical protein